MELSSLALVLINFLIYLRYCRKHNEIKALFKISVAGQAHGNTTGHKSCP